MQPFGELAEWSRIGLQIREHRFDSGTRLQIFSKSYGEWGHRGRSSSLFLVTLIFTSTWEVVQIAPILWANGATHLSGPRTAVHDCFIDFFVAKAKRPVKVCVLTSLPNVPN